MEKKKIFFILDWDFTYLFKDVAKGLQNLDNIEKRMNCLVFGKNYYTDMISGEIKHPFEKIYSIDEFYEKYIYNQNKIDNIEEKLEELEKRYGYETLWKFVWADRNHIKDGHEQNIYQIIQFFEYFESLYSEERPDIIITNAYASMPHLISYYVAKEMGIILLSGITLRIKEYMFWSEDSYEKLYPISKYTEDDIKSCRVIIDEFREKQVKRKAQVLLDKASNNIQFQHLKRFCNYFYNYYITKKYQGHTKPNPFKKLYKEELIPRIKQKYFRKFYKWDEYRNDDKYLYFPLHVQPEMTTMTYAHFYMNQFSLIEALSKNVPMSYKIYVKEHPAMIGKNTKDYYEKLRSLPNVFLVHPNVDSFQIIKNSLMITTINGTAGLEGLILGKPVVTFGKCFYNDCELVKYLGDTPITKWSIDIKDMLENYKINENKLESFLATYLHHSHDCILAEPGYLPEVLNEKNIETIINSLKLYLSKKYND